MKFYKAHCILFSAMFWCFLTLECAQKTNSPETIRARFPELYDAMEEEERKHLIKEDCSRKEIVYVQLLQVVRTNPELLQTFVKHGIPGTDKHFSLYEFLQKTLTVTTITTLPSTDATKQVTTFKKITDTQKITLENAIAIFHTNLYRKYLCLPESHPVYEKAPFFFEFLKKVKLKKSAPREFKEGLKALINNDIYKLTQLAKSQNFLPVLDKSFISEKTHPFYSMTVRNTLKIFFPEISKLIEQFEQKELEDRDTCFEPPSD